MIELFVTGIIWIGAGVLLFWGGALLFFPSKAIYHITRALSAIVVNSPALAEKKAKKHTQQLYEIAKKANPQTHEDFANRVLTEGLTALWRKLPDDFRTTVMLTIFEMHEEGAIEPPPLICNSVEGIEYRNKLSRLTAAPPDPQPLTEALVSFLSDLPASTGNDLTVPVAEYLGDQRPVVQNILAPFFAEKQGYKQLHAQLRRNLEAVDWVVPTEYKRDDVIFAYLHDTPFLQLFNEKVSFAIPLEARYQSQFILATQGAGKSVFLAHQISRIIPDILSGKSSAIVMDSQNTLIRTISRITALKDHIVLLDAEDVDYPIALSMFNLGMSGEGLTSLQQEQQYNSALALSMFVLDALGTDVTTKQSVPYRHLVALCMAIPQASILTFKDILDNGSREYQSYVDTLHPGARDFFNNKFNTNDFKKTRQEIGWRIEAILAIPMLRRILSSDTTRCSLFAEMNNPKGKIILINTARSTLQKEGCLLYGRLWLALIAMAAERRFTIKNPMPCHIFIDECDDYFGKTSAESIETIIQKCRKQNIALTVACRSLSELSASTRETLQTVAIKCVSSITPPDAQAMASGMHVRAETLTQHPPGTFSVYVRNTTPTAVTMTVPQGELEAMQTMTDEEYDLMVSEMRERYATQQPPQEEAVEAVHVESKDTRTGAKPMDDSIPENVVNVLQPPKKKKKLDLDNVDTTASETW